MEPENKSPAAPRGAGAAAEIAPGVREKRVLLHLWVVARCLRAGGFRTEEYYRYAEEVLNLHHNTALYELNALIALGLAERGESLRGIKCDKLVEQLKRL